MSSFTQGSGPEDQWGDRHQPPLHIIPNCRDSGDNGPDNLQISSDDRDLCPEALATLEAVVGAGLSDGRSLPDLFDLLGELTRRQRGQFWGHLKRSRPRLADRLRAARASLGEVA